MPGRLYPRALAALPAAVVALAFSAAPAVRAAEAPLLNAAQLRIVGGAGAQAGLAVTGAGDVNGDGVADVAITAPTTGTFVLGDGRVHVVFGSAAPRTVDLTALGPADGYTIEGIWSGQYEPPAVANAGDVDGDGVPDLAIGSPHAADPRVPAGQRPSVGRVSIVYGQRGAHHDVDLDALAPADGYAVYGAGTSDVGGDAADRLGFALAPLGDLNGDDIPDLAIGAPGFDGGGVDSGAAFVVFGRAGRPATALHLDALRTSEGYRIEGEQADEEVARVAAAGDVDGDGRDDVVVGSPYGGPVRDGYAAGWAAVVYGRASRATPIRLGALGTDGYAILGAGGFDGTGAAVAAAGDVNGDGVPDVAVGAPWADGYAADGAAYVVFGRRPHPSAPVDLAALAPGAGYRVSGAPGSEDFAGNGLANAGDVNGDGTPDLAVSTAGRASGGNGAVAVVFGRPTGAAAPFSLGALDATTGFLLTGAADVRVGAALAGLPDLDGDGAADLLVGAPATARDGTGRSGAAVVVGSAALRPAATTGGTADVQPRGATVMATASPGAATGSAYVEYGTTSAYGARTDAVALAAPGPLSIALGGLEPATTYRYRLVVESPLGLRAVGAEQTFTTASLPPDPPGGDPPGGDPPGGDPPGGDPPGGGTGGGGTGGGGTGGGTGGGGGGTGGGDGDAGGGGQPGGGAPACRASGARAVAGGTATLTLARPFVRGLNRAGFILTGTRPATLRGAALRLPLGRGALDRRVRAGRLCSEGGLFLHAGAHRATLQDLTVVLTARGRAQLRASFGGRPFTLATARPIRLGGRGASRASAPARATLTAAGASALRARLRTRTPRAGQPLGTLSLRLRLR